MCPRDTLRLEDSRATGKSPALPRWKSRSDWWKAAADSRQFFAAALQTNAASSVTKTIRFNEKRSPYYEKIFRLLHLQSRKRFVLTRKDLLITRKYFVLTRKDLLITRKYVVLTRKDLVITRKYVVLTRKDLFITT